MTNEFEITSTAVDALLKILKSHGHPDVPACARTLLKTPRTVDITSMSGMQYYHFGLKFMLVNTLQKFRKLH